MALLTPPPDLSKPRVREPPASLREPTAARMVRWRIRLLLFSLADIIIAQLIVLVFLPPGARLFDLQVICVALVLLGATPVAASLFQFILIGFHSWRIK